MTIGGAIRQTRRIMLIETLRNILRDVRLAMRALAQRRAFAITVLVTLAVGIGAPTAVFSVLHAVLLNPLPYAEPERIVRFRIESRSPRGTMSFDAMPATTALEWQRSSETLSSVGLFNERALTLTTAQGPYRLNGASVTPNMFELLRVPPLLGRAFDPSETDGRQILLGYETWRQHFAGRADVVGSLATFDGTDYRIAGVMPADFAFPTSDSAFWVPLLIEQGGGRGMLLPAIARLAPQATVAAVVEEGRRLLADSGDGREEMMLHARTLHETLVGTSRRVLWTLMAVVCVVSMIATANIALLLLVRGAARTREFSVRLAIGATRRHLAWQLFVEGVSLAVLGGAAGVALAIVLLGALVQLAPADIPRLRDATINGSALLFAAGLTCATSLLFALLSAGRTLAIDPVRALAGSGDEPRLIASGSPRRRLNLLTAGEIALTVVLLVAAGVLIRSFVSLVLIDHGFDSRGALALQVNLPSSRYPNPQARAAFHERLLERLKQFPDIGSVGLAVSMPNRQPSGRFDYNPDALPSSPDPFSMTVAEVRSVSEGFMEAMGLRLLAGRTFRSDDRPGAEPVMVISRKLARLHFNDQDPIGRMLYSLTGSRRVVGVVDDVRPLSGAEPQLSAYLPLQQSTDMLQWFGTMNIVVRADNAAALTTVAAVAGAVDGSRDAALQHPGARRRPVTAGCRTALQRLGGVDVRGGRAAAGRSRCLRGDGVRDRPPYARDRRARGDGRDAPAHPVGGAARRRRRRAGRARRRRDGGDLADAVGRRRGAGRARVRPARPDAGHHRRGDDGPRRGVPAGLPGNPRQRDGRPETRIGKSEVRSQKSKGRVRTF